MLQVYESLSRPSVANYIMYIEQLFEAKNSRAYIRYQVYTANTPVKYGCNCIRYECPKLWNSLSSTLRGVK